MIFPLAITPQQEGKPVRLHVKVDYAVCEKLMRSSWKGVAELEVNSGESSQETTLWPTEAHVPKRVTPAQLRPDPTADQQSGPKPLVTVDLGAPAGKPIELFAEGPTPQWALPIPKPVQNAPAGRPSSYSNSTACPRGADPKGQLELTFTVVTGERAVEVKSRLD